MPSDFDDLMLALIKAKIDARNNFKRLKSADIKLDNDAGDDIDTMISREQSAVNSLVRTLEKRAATNAGGSEANVQDHEALLIEVFRQEVGDVGIQGVVAFGMDNAITMATNRLVSAFTDLSLPPRMRPHTATVSRLKTGEVLRKFRRTLEDGIEEVRANLRV